MGRWICILGIAAGCATAEGADGPSDADIRQFETGFQRSCAAGFPGATPSTATAACTCLLTALYGSEGAKVVVPQMLPAANGGAVPPVLMQRLQDATPRCAGDVWDELMLGGCLQECTGDPATQAQCTEYCKCTQVWLRKEHPGEEGTRWMLANLGVSTPDGEKAMESAAAACTQGR